MNTSDSNTKSPHHGRNIKRFREMLGLKQEALAYELGEEWSQKRVSLLEQKSEIEPDILEKIAKILNIPSEAIRNFDQETAIHNIQNNYDNAIIHGGPTVNYQCSFNPIDKVVELYERLVQAEREKVALLEKLSSNSK